MASRIKTPAMQAKNSKVLLYVLIASLVIMAFTVYWNWFSPDQDYWPQLVADGITVIPAVGAAVAGTLLLRQFERGEGPWAVWFWLAVGWWAWVAGELVGMGYDLFRLEYGDLSVFDLFWVIGYLCFGLSLFHQIRNLSSSKKKTGVIYFWVAVAIVLILTLILAQWALSAGMGEGISWFALYLAIFYPVCDLAIGATALWLAFLFGRGAWGRPWWALIVFAVADGINIFLWIGGGVFLPEKVANFLDPLSATIYNGGYIVAMLGFLFILSLTFWSALPSETKSPELTG